MVGFCWGGKYMVWVGLEGDMIEGGGERRVLMDAGVVVHTRYLKVPGMLRR